ncbi:LHFPL tetraspan subfamily member 6 protein-like [Galendromus occidentalis]|uniref:LHFPL tetraspan subfamily member 6 protein-like n=1 Tax=Galendromus occidentalis TaxID=34638 RepID=A0AAJ7WHL7_9ACAR|nr:LHFPL tetraspan subfamily member 6 protein-like [Galendromus occidentalis]
MSLPLTKLGCLWCFASILNVFLSCCALFSPYWIRGQIFNNTIVHLGLLRRCNYPVLLENQRLDIVLECGRYADLTALPSIWWRAGILLAVVSCAVALFVTFIIGLWCAIDNSVSRITARFIGALQAIGGIAQLGSLFCYGMGFDNGEVREACGDQSAPFRLGPKCVLFWAFYIAVASGLLGVASPVLSWWACDIEYAYLYRISTKKDHLLRPARTSLRAWAAASL